MKSSVTRSAARRKEFGEFLRSRRERLSPAEVGLRGGSRRRTPGLRREEVSLLAGVGTTWYTWLEQGRDVHASAEVLHAVAHTLRLNQTERHHLFSLHGKALPGAEAKGPESVPESIQRMLHSLKTQPAYVLGRRWDVLVWNQAAVAVFGDYGKLPVEERNIMFLLFANADHRKLLFDWEEVARASLAFFRIDSAKYSGDPDFVRLIDVLTRRSRAFRTWWPKHEVSKRLTGLKRIQHPIAGPMVFEHVSFAHMDGSDMKLILYTPLPDLDSQQKMRVLLQGIR